MQVLEKEKKRSRKEHASGSDEEEDEEVASTQQSQRSQRKRSINSWHILRTVFAAPNNNFCVLKGAPWVTGQRALQSIRLH